MSGQVRVHNFAISLDGFGTGADQSVDAPFGHAGGSLMSWFFGTRRGAAIHGLTSAARGVDDAFSEAWDEGIGVEIMGRGKFAPTPEVLADESWRGWWGEQTPFTTPIIVLTSRPRPAFTTGDGVEFRFLDASPAEALAAARGIAGDGDVRIGGGVSTVREFLAADLIDHLHLVEVPIVLGRGERLWDGLEGVQERFAVESTVSPSGVVHRVFTRLPR
ncbi:dihydrofolate reductase family protein [Tsukamurella pseudospumae]|uniref:Deaminase n=1 Tax=Tsukamurella pseudospumae TaxID=239498 RepID=A0A138ATN7_9ACTN|nr:dihydrofolate reductase family protein [Tsukamurella pseudospumae]KXP13798.1 deaminase [Tsukamurella pseudospumae]